MTFIKHQPSRLFSSKRLFQAAILLMGAMAMNAWAAQNSLTGVSISRGKDNSQIMKVQFGQDIASDPVSFTTSNPNRLVLDFADTANAMGRGTEDAGVGVVKSYQAVQSGDRTRLVVNLNAPADYEIKRDKNTLYAVLKDTGPAGSKVSDKSTSAPITERSVRDVQFKRGKNGEAQVIVSLSSAGAGVDIQNKGRTIEVDFMNTSLPTPLQRRMNVADFGTAMELVETYTQGPSTRMVITPRGRWDYYSYQMGDQFIVEVRSLDDTRQVKGDSPKYSGEKLSLNFQNVDVRAVLQVIADFTGLNIIASDTVGGSITLRLKDVPWDQALDIIMRSRGLDKRMSGNVIWIAPRDELTAKEKAELEAKRDAEDLEPLITRSYKLNYVRADDAMVVLSGGSRRGANKTSDDATCSPSSTGIEAVDTTGAANNASTRTSQGGSNTNWSVNRVLSTRGSASHDLTTNTLIVTDIAVKQAAVVDVLKEIDIPTRQIMIEARIVIADDAFSRSLGARLGFQTQGKIGDSATGISNTAENSLSVANSGINSGSPNLNVNLPVTSGAAPSIGFTILNKGSEGLLSLELQALEADNRGKVVSNPRVVTTNLKPAVILQGTQVPYQTVSTNGTQTQFKDALLCLLVAPQVLNNDSVILNVEVQKDAVDRSYSPPAVNVRRVKTQVRVNNGETAILGGIFEQTLQNSTSKVPFLGDIPVLGHLFKTNTKADDKSEMLIFLTPRLLEDEGFTANH